MTAWLNDSHTATVNAPGAQRRYTLSTLAADLVLLLMAAGVIAAVLYLAGFGGAV